MPRQQLPIKHGTVYAYSRRGCRCPECTAANTRVHTAYMHRSGKRKPRELYLAEHAAAHPIKHGTDVGYARGCRCELCTKASSEARRYRRHRQALSMVRGAFRGGQQKGINEKSGSH